jgi:hypothetical protein
MPDLRLQALMPARQMCLRSFNDKSRRQQHNLPSVTKANLR